MKSIKHWRIRGAASPAPASIERGDAEVQRQRGRIGSMHWLRWNIIRPGKHKKSQSCDVHWLRWNIIRPGKHKKSQSCDVSGGWPAAIGACPRKVANADSVSPAACNSAPVQSYSAVTWAFRYRWCKFQGLGIASGHVQACSFEQQCPRVVAWFSVLGNTARPEPGLWPDPRGRQPRRIRERLEAH